ncbi:MAG: Panacea domain-containing protein [Firmicutes bacterium]|nr:Panacea domain-containing protein [Bacillota bacterium]
MTTPVFNLEKSLQVVLYVANRLQRKDFHKIFKVIYFADREHLSKYGRPITGDTYIAMKDGPVPSKIDDIFKAVRGDSFFSSDAAEYANLFSVHEWFFIKPKVDANLDYLSQSDIEELDDSLNKYGTMSWDEIRKKSHDFAWHATPENKQINIDDILRELGEDEDYIAYISENIALQRACL